MEKHLPPADVPAADFRHLNSKPTAVRVLHLHTHTAWDYGLAQFLSQDSDLKVISVAVASQLGWLSDLTLFKPTVILLNQDVPLSLAHLRHWLGGRLARSVVRLVVINLYDNLMDIYDSHQKQQVAVTHLTDISQCVRGLYPA
jgi:hypothetical protein